MLEKKLITPPIFLSMDDEDVVKGSAAEPEDEEEAAFLNFAEENQKSGGLGQNSAEKGKLFSDADYSEDNKTLNRVKQFTFIKDQRP